MGTDAQLATQAEVSMCASVPMADGVLLATDVYLPADRSAPVPVVLSRIPYDRRGPLCFLSAIASRFVERGWAFVGQDVRGKFGSEGERHPFLTEVEDGRATLEWLAAQPWSDGRVVMVGDSYCGYTQLAAASSAHPALKAITPRVTSAEIHDDWLFHQGVPCLSTAAAWALFAWSRPNLAEGAWEYACTPLSELATRNLGHDLPVLQEWFGGVAGGVAPLSSWSIPTLHLAGWWDVFQRGQLTTWARHRADHPDSAWLHVAATDHQWTEVHRDGTASSGRAPSGDPTAAFIDRYLAPILHFFDHVLAGAVAPEHIVVEVVGGGSFTTTSWPPPAAVVEELFLVDGHRALHGPEGGGLAKFADESTSVTWVHDPAQPVPDLVADPWSLDPGLPDERDVELRDDVATFTSSQYTHDLLLCGPIQATVDIEADAPSTHVVAKLVDVDPLGRAQRICEGIAVATGPYPARAVIDLGHTAYRLDAGHQLRLEIASSMFPRYALHPGTGESPWLATARHPSRQRLLLGPGSSVLRIHTIPEPSAKSATPGPTTDQLQ